MHLHWWENMQKKWIERIEDCTALTREIKKLKWERRFDEAQALLPQENAYPVNRAMATALGMDI
jgi:hypothetical protein